MEYCDNTIVHACDTAVNFDAEQQRTLPGSDSKALFPAVLISSLAALQI